MMMTALPKLCYDKESLFHDVMMRIILKSRKSFLDITRFILY